MPVADPPLRLALLPGVFRPPSDCRLLARVIRELESFEFPVKSQEAMGIINKDAASVYRYMNFDQIEEYAETAKGVTV